MLSEDICLGGIIGDYLSKSSTRKVLSVIGQQSFPQLTHCCIVSLKPQKISWIMPDSKPFASHALVNALKDLFHPRFAGEIIMRVAYGLEIRPSNDPYVALAKQAAHGFSVAHIPGRFLVVSIRRVQLSIISRRVKDSIPILKYVPSWLPGAEFKRKARRWRVLARAMVDTPFAEAKRNTVNLISLTGSLVTIFFNRHWGLTRPHLHRAVCAQLMIRKTKNI